MKKRRESWALAGPTSIAAKEMTPAEIQTRWAKRFIILLRAEVLILTAPAVKHPAVSAAIVPLLMRYGRKRCFYTSVSRSHLITANFKSYRSEPATPTGQRE